MHILSPRLRAWRSHVLPVATAVIVLLATALAPPVQAQSTAMVVRNDRGGLLGQRNAEIRALRASGQRVELRGLSLSACTMYLSLPNACVSPSAIFGFHGPSRGGRPLPAAEFEHWSELMARNYREPLRSWFMAKGRFITEGYFEMSGAELIRLGYPNC